MQEILDRQGDQKDLIEVRAFHQQGKSKEGHQDKWISLKRMAQTLSSKQVREKQVCIKRNKIRQ